QHFLELARKHIEAVRQTPTPEPEWYAAFEGLYPFTDICLHNIWDGLRERGHVKRTPRLLLRVLREALSHQKPPFIALGELSRERLAHPRTDLDTSLIADGATADNVRALANWYGA